MRALIYLLSIVVLVGCNSDCPERERKIAYCNLLDVRIKQIQLNPGTDRAGIRTAEPLLGPDVFYCAPDRERAQDALNLLLVAQSRDEIIAALNGVRVALH